LLLLFFFLFISFPRFLSSVISREHCRIERSIDPCTPRLGDRNPDITIYIFVISRVNCRVMTIEYTTSHSRFSCPLMYTRTLLSSLSSALIITIIIRRFAYVIRDHPVFPLQSMVISNQKAQYFSDFVKKFHDMGHVKI